MSEYGGSAGAAMRQPNGSAGLPGGNLTGEAATDRGARQSSGSDAQRIQAEAREVYRQSVAAEMPLSGKKLGEMFGRSERWGRDRIKEVKDIDAEQVSASPPVSGAGFPEDLPENGGAVVPVSSSVPSTGVWRSEENAAAPELPDADTATDAATDAAADLDVRQSSGSLAAEIAAPKTLPEVPSAVPPVPGGNVTTPELPGGSARAATTPRESAVKWPRRWPLLLLAFPAGVATWSGWVGLGGFTGFGVVHPLPGIWDSATINSAITLPIGVEAYAAYALSAWLTSAPVSDGTRQFAKVSAIAALLLGMLGQVAYHLLDVAHNAKVSDFAQKHGQSLTEAAKHVPTAAPWWITTLVACLPVLVLGFGAGLAHMLHRDQTT